MVESIGLWTTVAWVPPTPTSTPSANSNSLNLLADWELRLTQCTMSSDSVLTVAQWP